MNSQTLDAEIATWLIKNAGSPGAYGEWYITYQTLIGSEHLIGRMTDRFTAIYSTFAGALPENHYIRIALNENGHTVQLGVAQDGITAGWFDVTVTPNDWYIINAAAPFQAVNRQMLTITVPELPTGEDLAILFNILEELSEYAERGPKRVD